MTRAQAVAAFHDLDPATVDQWPTDVVDVFYRRLVRRGALITAA